MSRSKSSLMVAVVPRCPQTPNRSAWGPSVFTEFHCCHDEDEWLLEGIGPGINNDSENRSAPVLRKSNKAVGMRGGPSRVHLLVPSNTEALREHDGDSFRTKVMLPRIVPWVLSYLLLQYELADVCRSKGIRLKHIISPLFGKGDSRLLPRFRGGCRCGSCGVVFRLPLAESIYGRTESSPAASQAAKPPTSSST